MAYSFEFFYLSSQPDIFSIKPVYLLANSPCITDKPLNINSFYTGGMVCAVSLSSSANTTLLKPET